MRICKTKPKETWLIISSRENMKWSGKYSVPSSAIQTASIGSLNKNLVMITVHSSMMNGADCQTIVHPTC